MPKHRSDEYVISECLPDDTLVWKFMSHYYWITNLVFSFCYAWRDREYILTHEYGCSIDYIFRNNLEERRKHAN